MKKTVIALTLLTFAGCLSAETNVPLIMKGLYGTRSSSAQTERPRSTHNVTTDALHRFVGMQNPDGSWGADGTQQLSTAFCLISFLRHGETRDSEKCGKPITNSATGFSVMSLTVYYIWSDRFSARTRSNPEEAGDQEIKINL